MSEAATLTIRLGSDLKTELERAAEAQDRTVTEFVLRAVKARMRSQCTSCGRSEQSVVAPPGFTEAFDRFLVDVRRESNGNIPFMLMTSEPAHTRSYCLKLEVREEHQGTVVGFVALPDGSIDWQTKIGVPRGLIVGWSFDQEVRHHARNVALGCIDGNAFARLALASRAR